MPDMAVQTKLDLQVATVLLTEAAGPAVRSPWSLLGDFACCGYEKRGRESRLAFQDEEVHFMQEQLAEFDQSRPRTPRHPSGLIRLCDGALPGVSCGSLVPALPLASALRVNSNAKAKARKTMSFASQGSFSAALKRSEDNDLCAAAARERALTFADGKSDSDSDEKPDVRKIISSRRTAKRNGVSICEPREVQRVTMLLAKVSNIGSDDSPISPGAKRIEVLDCGCEVKDEDNPTCSHVLGRGSAKRNGVIVGDQREVRRVLSESVPSAFSSQDVQGDRSQFFRKVSSNFSEWFDVWDGSVQRGDESLVWPARMARQSQELLVGVTLREVTERVLYLVYAKAYLIDAGHKIFSKEEVARNHLANQQQMMDAYLGLEFDDDFVISGSF